MKKIQKIDRLRNNVKGSKGFSWDLGEIAFGKRTREDDKKNKSS